MNLRLRIGQLRSRIEIWLLCSFAGRFLRQFPYRRHWAFDVLRFLSDRQPRVIFDIGANVGQTTEYLHRFFPHASCYAFEPAPTTFRALTAAVGHLKTVSLHPFAFGEGEGTRPMAVYDYSDMSTLVIPPGLVAAGGVTLERVAVRTVDSFCAEQHIERIDILKMDVEAYESKVLRGCQRMLTEGRIDYIYSEVGFDRNILTRSAFTTLHPILEENGYVLAGFYEFWGPERSKLEFCNALYRRASLNSKQ